QTLDLMQRTLSAAGFATAVANDDSALNRSTQESIPALIVLGEKLAERDGLSIAAEMLERFPTLPIILYADKDTSGTAKSALKLGLSGYLYPPLKMADIVEEVQKSLARARKLGDWLRREVKRTTSSLAEKAEISETERSKLEAIIANIQDGVIVLDDQKRILLANNAMHDIFKLKRQELSGKMLEQVIQNADLRALITRSSREPLKYHEINFDDGRVFNAQYTPIPNIGAAVTMQDISYLKELDRLKSDFIHTISHDLRSPLTAVLGYTELIERTGALNESQQEFLRRLQSSVQHITTLINDLLDLGRLEAGFDVRRELVQMEDVLKYSLDMFDGEVKKKQVTLVVNIDSDIQPLRANPIRIRQMIDNLVGNAIKYTPYEGKVQVDLFMRDKQIIFKVEDTGPGIPPEEHNRVFEKFFRATNAPESVQGSGLGLAIVKSIVDSHQGRVWVESTVGKGSAFTVILPPQE
ncbi:MAG: ATP-binding protein, partial [Anaerolineales bacterium]|nr:ATP-binding protein [Anaerolineales bacterium]